MKRFLTIAIGALTACVATAEEKWLSFTGNEGPGKGKHIVLVSGDEEYRSEETMPMLAKILSHRHGFDCTVLFSWSKDGKYIDPNNAGGVRGWDQLAKADLMIIGTRMRTVAPKDAKYMTDFLNTGKPVVGYRTSTHAFKGSWKFDTISGNDWGIKIVGERWVNHHGKHKGQGARGVIEPANKDHAILNSVKDIFGPSDVYGVKNLIDADTVLLRGAVTETLDPTSKNVSGKQNEPMMALAWLHPYTAPNGTTKGQAFCTTMGASVDFLSEDLRRIVVNATYHLLGLKVLDKADVDYVDPFFPSFYGFWNGKHAKIWSERKMVPADFGLGKTPHVTSPPGTPDWPHMPMKK
ncbi:MAG: hypothetical protein CBC46_07315 [Verrucomicrobiaceae bacterium TMED86]|nr:MAG: hypothetical protein CBC46_07315 [Verrucomicrobiaceae bacterium TMED86]